MIYLSNLSHCTFFSYIFAIALFVSFLGIGSHFPVYSNHWSAVLNQLLPCSSFYFCSCAFLHFWGCKSSVQNLAMITSVINPVGTLTLFLKVYWRCFRYNRVVTFFAIWTTCAYPNCHQSSTSLVDNRCKKN